MNNKRVAVIGGGFGGLSAAIYLANYGYKVDLFEKNSDTGGKAGLVINNGFKFDTGPSIITLPYIIDSLFEDAGFEREKYFEYAPLNPICRNFFSDGSKIDTLHNLLEMKSELNRCSSIDAENYPKFINHIQSIYENIAEIFMYEPLHEVKKLINEKKFPSIFDFQNIDAFRTLHDANSSFFKDKRIIQMFDRYAPYNGSNPYSTSGSMNISTYISIILGSYYIKGGIFKLNEAIKKLAVKSGVNIHLNSYVDAIIVENNTVERIKINGIYEKYDFVISNCNVITTFNKLIEGFDSQTTKLNKLEPSLSAFVMLFGIKKTFNNLIHHNIFYSNDYKKEFNDIFTKKVIPDDPTINISISSKTDQTHAPEGCENWVVQSNMPYLNKNINWNEEKYRVKDIILTKLKSRNIDLNSLIEFEQIFTPQDFYDNYLSNKGSIFGISSNDWMTAFLRPANRSKQIKNLYFAGGSTYPGGRIPLVILSGKHAAELLKYYDINER
jgi:phytoene desaturase